MPLQREPCIVAISRQMGTGAHHIAAAVAEELGLPLLDQEIINHAAAAAGVAPDVIAPAERMPSLITRIVENLRLYSLSLEPEGLATTALPPNLMLTSSDYRNLIDRVVQQIADQQSAVIFGHGAARTLADRPGVLRVFVVAPFELRVQRHARELGISREKARQLVRDNDRDRERFFRHYYDIDWVDSRRYDLTLNTGRLHDAVATELIVAAAHAVRSNLS